MSVLKGLQKNLRAHHLLGLLGVLVLVVAVSQFSERKAGDPEGLAGSSYTGHHGQQHGPAHGERSPQAQALTRDADAAAPNAAMPRGQNEVYASAKGIGSPSVGLPPSCVKANATKPGDLLPKDANSQWGRLNPTGGGGLENVNLLKAGYHTGIDTVGTVLRNANLQVRSEPPNPTAKVSPWMNTTIEPDLMRVPLEIGCGPQ
tara:strand:+ start:41 stop:649 length:609 start_codon:yes stop_codon:yes gene_type:complete